MNLLQKLNRKYGKFSVPHLMYIICGGMLVVFAAELLLPQYNIAARLTLNMVKVYDGEWWRLLTFLFIPPSDSPVWLLFGLYFYALIGDGLERELGSFCFTLFYLIGAVSAVLAAPITGYGHNTYLNLSLFLAFAMFYPDFRVSIFFFIPVRIKYLAIVDLVLYVLGLIFGNASVRVTILLSLLNLLIFFGGDAWHNLQKQVGYWKTRRNFRKNYRS